MNRTGSLVMIAVTLALPDYIRADDWHNVEMANLASEVSSLLNESAVAKKANDAFERNWRANVEKWVAKLQDGQGLLIQVPIYAANLTNEKVLEDLRSGGEGSSPENALEGLYRTGTVGRPPPAGCHLDEETSRYLWFVRSGQTYKIRMIPWKGVKRPKVK